MELASSLSGHRIAFITGVVDLGGTTTFLCNVAGEFIRRGVPTSVYSLKYDHPLARDFEQQKIPVFRTDNLRMIYEDCMQIILREVARFRPTVMVANLTSTSFEALRYAPPGVFKVGMAQSHDPGVYHTIGFYADQVDAMGAVSKAIHEKIPQMPPFGRVPVHYLPYGVPIPPARNQDPPNSGAPLRVLYLGRLEETQKRVRCFPQILGRLEAAGIPFHWTIAGDGSEAGWLKSVMKSPAAHQTISFPGKIAYSEVTRVLAEHDIYLLASEYEGLPLSLLEAMAGGLVPVVSDLPSGIREVVDEDSGLLVDPTNVAGYADAIIRLHRDRNELAHMREHVRGRVEREFSVAAMTDRWVRMLPPPPAEPPTWPGRFSIRPILMEADNWRYTAPARILRRWGRRLKNLKG